MEKEIAMGLLIDSMAITRSVKEYFRANFTDEKLENLAKNDILNEIELLNKRIISVLDAYLEEEKNNYEKTRGLF